MSKFIDQKELRLQKEVEAGITKAVSGFSDVQIRDGLRSAMMINLASGEVPQEIAEQIKIWDDLAKSDSNNILRSPEISFAIRRTMEVFYEYFKSKDIDLDSLKKDSPFASSMILHSTNAIVACHDMGLFCRYIALVSQKSPDHQKVLLDSFPPKTSADIACIGGTGSRIGELIQQIQGSKEDQYFVESHKTLTGQLIDKMRYSLPAGLPVHASPFLDYALSLESPESVAKRDPCFSFPYASMNVAQMWDFFTSYGKKIREIVGQKTSESEDFRLDVENDTSELLRELSQINLDAALTDYSSDLGKNARKEIEFVTGRILNKTGDESANDSYAISLVDLVELDEEAEEEKYVLSPSKIAAVVATRKFVNFKSKDGEDSPTPNQGLLDEISEAASIFDSKTVDNLSRLIQSNDRREVEAAVELLWILGANMKGGSPLQFVRTINAINKDDKIKYLNEEVKGKIGDLYHDKLTKITYDYKKHSENLAIKSRLDLYTETSAKVDSFAALLSVGATSKEIKSHIIKSQNTPSINFFDAFQVGILTKKLTDRIDCTEILAELKKTNIDLKTLPNALFKESVFANKPELCHYILDNFEIDKSVFNDEKVLIRVMGLKEGDLTNKVIEKYGVEYLAMKRPFCKPGSLIHLGLAPLHHAVILGEEDAVKEIVAKGVDPNLRTGANIFKPNSLVPVNPIRHMDFRRMVEEFPFSAIEPLCYLLAAFGYVFSETPMHLAARCGRSSMIDVLTERGGDIDALAYGKDLNLCVRPLHCAIAGGYKVAAENLIEKGASLETKTAFEPPLARVAVVNNQPQCFEMLMNKGVKIKPSQLDQYCLLSIVKFSFRPEENKEMIELLIRNGAYVPNGETNNSLIKSARLFQQVSKAIMWFATESIVNPSPESREKLTELEREIYKTLIKTYDLKKDDLIADFGLRNLRVGQENQVNDKIRNIGKNIALEMGVEAAKNPINFSLKRIFSYSTSPIQDVDISRDKDFVKESLSSREAIATIPIVLDVDLEKSLHPSPKIKPSTKSGLIPGKSSKITPSAPNN